MITLMVELQPFNVPNYVIQQMPPGKREDGWKEAPKYKLSEVSEVTLSKLCDDFRRAVFEKAGKLDPRSAMPQGYLAVPTGDKR